jgi:hypothetical protein
VSSDRVRDARAELRRERQQAERLREDYRTLVGSRFYALRMLWLSAKSMLGFRAGRRAFTAWNAGMLAPSEPVPDVGVAVDPDEVRAQWRKRIAGSAMAGQPVVTIVIPVFNHLDDTLRCLQSIAQTWFDSLRVEFIVADDASEDRTQAVLHDFQGINYVRQDRNLGFLRYTNLYADQSLGT